MHFTLWLLSLSSINFIWLFIKCHATLVFVKYHLLFHSSNTLLEGMCSRTLARMRLVWIQLMLRPETWELYRCYLNSTMDERWDFINKSKATSHKTGWFRAPRSVAPMYCSACHSTFFWINTWSFAWKGHCRSFTNVSTKIQGVPSVHDFAYQMADTLKQETT